MRFLALLGVLAALLLAAPGHAAEFAFEVTAPKFRVTLPHIPAMQMRTHPLNAKQPHLRYLGSDGPYTVSVITPSAAAGMSALECASATLRSMAARPGIPPSAQMYKARLDDNTYVAIYTAELEGIVQLHAHVLSAAGGTHCVEVHASRMSTAPEDLESWVKGFDAARIVSR